jgi:hypothetical protein
MLFLWSVENQKGLFQPGTQPETIGTILPPVTCIQCHGGYDERVEPGFTWQGTMMANASRDPLFYAALAIANQDRPGGGDFCLRCHSPVGWLAGRSNPTDGSALTASDRQGVQCDFCHQLVDPLSDEGKALVEPDVPGYGSAMYIVAPGAKRGPYKDVKTIHESLQSQFHLSGNLCGTCHDVSNPLFAKDSTTQPPHEYGVVERTYSEWLLSDYSKKGQEGSCQHCHLSRTTGRGAAQHVGIRSDLAIHDLTGGNAWIPEALPLLWGNEVNAAALRATKQRAIATLRRAATLDLSFPKSSILNVRITNETGHKLFTGYPEGRRMWINLKCFDANGAVLAESGKYDFVSDRLKGSPVNVPTLIPDKQLKVYEVKPGLTMEWAAQHGLPPGPSFHFILNNTIVKDNRIPPRGFTNAAFKARLAQPVGYAYADGQYWDDTPYELPHGTTKVQVTLHYQTASWEYIKFLTEENRTNDWGKKLYDVWTKSGFSSPVAMATATASVPTAPITSVWDINKDGVVDILDIVIVGQNFGQSPLVEKGADVDQNGVVDILDLVLVAQHFGERTAIAIKAAPSGIWRASPDQRKSIEKLYQALLKEPGRSRDLESTLNLLRSLLESLESGNFAESSRLLNNYPNPANPETWLPYQLDRSTTVTIRIYNAVGQLVRTLNLGWKNPGIYIEKARAAYWDGRNEKGEVVASGVYFYTMQADGWTSTRRLILVR